jgi:hypothetical protein
MRTALYARGINELNILNHTAIKAGLRSVRITATVKKTQTPFLLTINKYSSRSYNICQLLLTHRPTQTVTVIKYGYKGCTRIFQKNVGTTSKF